MLHDEGFSSRLASHPRISLTCPFRGVRKQGCLGQRFEDSLAPLWIVCHDRMCSRPSRRDRYFCSGRKSHRLIDSHFRFQASDSSMQDCTKQRERCCKGTRCYHRGILNSICWIQIHSRSKVFGSQVHIGKYLGGISQRPVLPHDKNWKN